MLPGVSINDICGVKAALSLSLDSKGMLWLAHYRSKAAHTTDVAKIKKTNACFGKGPSLFLLRSQLKPKNAEIKMKSLQLMSLTHG